MNHERNPKAFLRTYMKCSLVTSSKHDQDDIANSVRDREIRTKYWQVTGFGPGKSEYLHGRFRVGKEDLLSSFIM